MSRSTDFFLLLSANRLGASTAVPDQSHQLVSSETHSPLSLSLHATSAPPHHRLHRPACFLSVLRTYSVHTSTSKIFAIPYSYFLQVFLLSTYFPGPCCVWLGFPRLIPNFFHLSSSRHLSSVILHSVTLFCILVILPFSVHTRSLCCLQRRSLFVIRIHSFVLFDFYSSFALHCARTRDILFPHFCLLSTNDSTTTTARILALYLHNLRTLTNLTNLTLSSIDILDTFCSERGHVSPR